MNRFTKSVLVSLCVSLMLVSAVVLIPATPHQSQSAPARPASQINLNTCVVPLLPPLIPCALPALPSIPTLPLVEVTIPPRDSLASTSGSQTAVGTNNSAHFYGVNYQPAPAAQSAATPTSTQPPATSTTAPTPTPVSCTSPTIDLKVLIIAADPTDTNTALPAIQQALDFQGTPYTVFTASPRPSDPTTNRLASLLSNGCHAFFEGVILGNGQVAYSDPTAGWESALTDPEWQSLYAYEQTFKIRQVSWYTFPDANYGFNAPNSSGDTTTSPISANYTSAGQPIYSYANTSNPLTIQNAWAYKATPLDSNTSALLSDSSGNALVAIKTYSNGTQNLAMTFDGNPNLTHTVALSYGTVNWVTNGLFLGARHIFLVPQEDDLFIDDHIWPPTTACGTDPETTPVTYRITGDDWNAFSNWQSNTKAQPTTNNFTLTNAFVGEGTNGEYNPDTLTPAAQANESNFNWVNHTYNHTNLDNTDYNTTMSEITQDIQVAQQMGFTNFSTLNLITPDISGLSNANAMQAIHDAGIRYVVSDTSRAGMNNPAPNIGIYNQYQPSVLEIPRIPNNLFYNVSQPSEWAAEYNCFYASYWGSNQTYAQILDHESSVLSHYMMEGNMDPWMFHQPNMRAYDGTHSLLGDLMDATLSKYNAVFSLPIVDPTMDNLGSQMADFMAYKSAGVTASMVPGQSITITSQQNAAVPVTGLQTSGAENYGGQPIAHVNVNAGQSVTLCISQSCPTPTPVATNTPTVTPTNTATPTATSIIPTLTLTLPPPPTITLLPPTATNTPLPAPTNTPAPTATNTPVPTPTCTAPVAANDSYSMHLLNVQLVVPPPGVLGNDSSGCGPLTAVLASGPSHGLLTLNSNGGFTYTPLTSLLTFSDSFTYKAFDGTNNSNVATVTIQVIVP